ncbi:MAG: nitroreductase [Bradymonadia bacterium]|jgi:nitroreductase
MADTSIAKEQRTAAFNRWKARLTMGPKQFVRRIATAWSPLADLYYAIFDRSFAREHRGVLHGTRRYHELHQQGAANRFQLRRNTHRLEKGLLMKPRRDVFAIGYLQEMMDAYELGLASIGAGGDSEEIRWSHDVLTEYFSVCGPNEVVDVQRARFEALPPISRPADEPASVPYQRDLDGPLPVEFEAFQKLAKRRRSVRWFLDTPVPRELVDQAIVAAAEAPSACNRQPFHFRVFDDPELVQTVSTLPMGTKGFAHNFPMIVVVVGQLRAYFKPRDRHLIYIDGSLASMSFMFALETLGLSSCPINWPDIPAREKQMAKQLNLEPDQRPIMLIAIGYPDPDGAVAFSHKQSLDHLRSYNK